MSQPSRGLNPAKVPALPALWIVFCAYCNFAGWLLSALHQLNAAGYLVAFLLAAAALGLMRQWFLPALAAGLSWRRLKQRLRRPFPAGVAVLALLAILGGVLHAPNNDDALALRT